MNDVAGPYRERERDGPCRLHTAAACVDRASRKVKIMDPIIQSNLVTLHIEDLLRERQPRHEAGSPWHSSLSPAAIDRPALPPWYLRLCSRLRRRFGVILIQAGRRIGDGGQRCSHPLYGSAHR